MDILLLRAVYGVVLVLVSLVGSSAKHSDQRYHYEDILVRRKMLLNTHAVCVHLGIIAARNIRGHNLAGDLQSTVP